MDKEIMRFDKVTKRFGSKTALNDLDISIERGRIVGLLGPNGSGKTTFIKLANGLLHPDSGTIHIDDRLPGPETRAVVSYLPDRMYFADWMKVKDLAGMFEDFYSDFSRQKARDMMDKLGIDEKDRIKNMSKGTKEKVQLIFVMSRNADLYILDEPIAGVDPAARDYILKTIISNYNENASILLSTHLISDIEAVLDDVIFLKTGQLMLQSSVEDIRSRYGKSVDGYFREVFAC